MMLQQPPPRTGLLLRLYMALRPIFRWLGPRVLASRIAKGKEDPARAPEKLGQASLPRPEGLVIWLHAVGLGEVLALRGLVTAMAALRPDLTVLITSTAQSSARVIGANLPPRCLHQYLPLDAPDYMARFLDHWRPSLSVWAEQDIWPGAVMDCHARGIPVAMVNARVTADSLRRRRRVGGLYRDLFARLSLIAAQDAATAARLAELGACAVRVTGSLKPAAPPLSVDAAALGIAAGAVAGRRVWVAASTHEADESEVIAAQQALFAADPAWLLVLVPRLPGRAGAMTEKLAMACLPMVRRSLGGQPDTKTAVWLADSFGELGLWYRLADAAFVGASFGGLGGHNPWEPAALGTAVFHGPDVANFRSDYQTLDGAGAARHA